MFELLSPGSDEENAIVVAHPDDESFGFTSILAQCPNAFVICVTDGAPSDEAEWGKAGSRDAYRTIRAAELDLALNLAGHTGPRSNLGIPDTETLHHLDLIVAQLSRRFKEFETQQVFTHAYEGGHPDHDAVAFAVHAAKPKSIIEAPFYRMQDGEPVSQIFEPWADREEYVYPLEGSLKDLKRRMLIAHASQSLPWERLLQRPERFRIAPRYDFTQPPNRGELSRNYRRAGIDADGLVAIFTAALARLG